jgi:hypothetical protein
MEGLGRLFDVGTGVVPVDLNTADGATGKRVSMVGAKGITIVAFIGAAASGTDDVVLTVKQHTAYTGGTSGTAPTISHAYVKSETALDNDESWAALTPVGGVITLAGATYAAVQKLVAIEVDPRTLSDGYTHISLDAAVTTAAVQLAGVLYIMHNLFASRAPANLGNLLRPGAANA